MNDTKNIRKVKSSSLQRKVESYPPPQLHDMLNEFARQNEMSKSEASVYMMRTFFNSLPPAEVVRYRSKSTY